MSNNNPNPTDDNIKEASQRFIDIALELRRLYTFKQYEDAITLVHALDLGTAHDLILTQVMMHDIEIEKIKEDHK